MPNSRPKRQKVRREDFSATIDYVIFIIRGFPLYTYSMLGCVFWGKSGPFFIQGNLYYMTAEEFIPLFQSKFPNFEENCQNGAEQNRINALYQIKVLLVPIAISRLFIKVFFIKKSFFIQQERADVSFSGKILLIFSMFQLQQI